MIEKSDYGSRVRTSMIFWNGYLRRYFWGYLILMCISMMSLGCANVEGVGGTTVSGASPDFFGISENLAGQLSSGLRRPLGNSKRLILTTMVDIDNLYQTSRFGRTLTETLATSMFRHDFGVVEVRKSLDLLFKNSKGELMLTRDAGLLAKQYEAEAVAVGTYSMTSDSVIINVRLLGADSHNVLAVAGLEVQRSDNINYLLAMSGGEMESSLSVYER